MILSGYELNKLSEGQNSINLIFSNPYIKYNQMIPDKKDSPFYICIFINDTNNNEKDISIVYNQVDEYDDLDNLSIKTIYANETKKYNLKIGEESESISILYQSCGNSLKEINIYHYDDIINTFVNKNKYNLAVFNNYLIQNQIGPIFINDEGNKYSGVQVSFNLKEISQEEIDNLNNDENKEIYQNETRLYWTKLNNADEYTIYIFNQKNKDIKYIQNICYLDYIKSKNIKEQKETDPEYIGIYSTKENYYNVKEEGIYLISVVANLGNKIPLKYIFKEIKYDSNLVPHNGINNKNGNIKLILIISLSVGIPLIIIAIIILIFYIRKKRRKNYETDVMNLGKRTLLKPSITSVS